ncbi:MAG: hypothetical protein ACO3QI_02620, partial [Ilumatobacteraceae bacterium]
MSITEERTNNVIGQRMLRREDPALLTGEAKFVNDLAIPGALHLAVLRSPYAHARIKSIDVSDAASMPGVVAVYTGKDLQSTWAAPMPCAWPVTPDMKNPAHYPLAVDKACYVGDGVAAVLATSETASRDALDAIDACECLRRRGDVARIAHADMRDLVIRHREGAAVLEVEDLETILEAHRQ